jgi:putative effector of murein hydrolase
LIRQTHPRAEARFRANDPRAEASPDPTFSGSESLHADPSLTAVAVALTGIMGAIAVTPLMNRIGVTDFRARGFAAGLPLTASARRGRFRSMRSRACSPASAMSLNALVTSLLVPLAVTLLVR